MYNRFTTSCGRQRCLLPVQHGIHLVVVASADNFFACWAEKDGMLELGSHAALDIAQRRVSLHDALFDQFAQLKVDGSLSACRLQKDAIADFSCTHP